MTRRYVPLDSQSREVLARTRYGALTCADSPDGERWWLLLDPTEAGHFTPAGTAIDLGDTKPTTEELRSIVARLGFVTSTDWEEPRFASFRSDFGMPVLTARVSTPQQIKADEQRARRVEEIDREEAVAELKREATWRTSIAIAASAGLLAALLNWPAGYYGLMRLMLLVTCVVLGVLVHRATACPWPWFFGLALVALIWNPVVPIWMSREAWIPLDVAGAVFFAMLASWSKGRLPSKALPRTQSIL
ncbi:hypothetical protein E3T54_13630 [Cryobacterium sp. Sr8]|uniref:DUF6804 family protein n=1 Tax=Cryobacterium sp. Sr8 TaxID=1259203 RepID=UPI0010695CC4|nr:DUF6804 family protein [Cryobacterium sp. Sr8]TFD74612.1 hypothetical protein E3T54_13630 [Cryobacterium sp. Sr8]